jgi:hypothetical protein
MLLDKSSIHPVLVDVGAASGPPAYWDPIASVSTYVGFDPDAREGGHDNGRYARTVILDRAVTAGGDDRAHFFLTASPHCSSTLRPDSAALRAYQFAPLFDVVSEADVPATTLQQALTEVGVEAADWIKLDTQGTDLRIFNALGEETRRRTLVVDVEPGFMDAYQGEDLFIEAHRSLSAQGFWLSRLDVGSAVRGSPATLRRMRELNPAITEWSISRRARPSPYWCEARYFRTPQFLVASGLGAREMLLLGMFALLDEQWPFAFEVLTEYDDRHGRSTESAAMQAECLSRLEEIPSSPLRALSRRWLPAGVRRRLKNVADALRR